MVKGTRQTPGFLVWQRGQGNFELSNEMCDFLILNISSLQLIPVNIIAFRTEYGSVTPTAIVGPAILATAISTGAAVLYIKTKNWMARPEKANNIFTKMVLKNEKASHIMGESK